MKQTILLLSFFLLTIFQSKASHLAGGQLTYENIGSNYLIKLRLYRDCSGIPLPSSAVITVSSASQSTSFNISMLQSGAGVVSIPCPGGTNTCYTPSSNIPGFSIADYRTVIALPAAASDWTFSYNVSARTNTQNLVGTPNMQLTATLNNLNGPNNNTYIPNMPPFYITTNSVTVPLQALDADGDSIVFDRIAPQISANTSATYNVGYSATAPFGSGGTYTINNTNQTMTLQGSILGKFALAFRVKEYRNGVLVGSYIRDFLCGILPSSGIGTLTYPMLNNPQAATAYACPGKSGIVTLGFTDPNSTDSVFVTVDTPAITGWNFNVSTTYGKPTGGATISWTAPSTLNPATLPYFFVNLKVWDNSCPRAVADYALLIKTQQCPTDSVWPGDANSDKVANLLDVLAIAIAYNQTGPTRPNASISWTPQWSQNWANTYPFSTVNEKHGDCNGDGTINAGDLAAIAANYSLTHPKGGQRSKTSGLPDLYFDFTGIVLAPGKTVAVPVKLGTSADPMNNIYGLGTSVELSGLNLTSQATITTTGSWLGNSSNTLEFNKTFSKSSIDWGFARTDQQNVSGNGTIAMLNFTVPSDATPGKTVNFSLNNTVMTDKDGNPITAFNAVDGNATIQPAGISDNNELQAQASIVPNPSGNDAHLQVILADAHKVDIRVTDVTGRTLYHMTEQLNAGANMVSLPAANMVSGIYTVHVTTNKGSNSQILKWIKQ